MFAVDLHTHSRFFHGFRGQPTPFDPIGVRLTALFARKRGLDAIAVTNHDYHRPFDIGGITVIPGIEVSSTRGHVLVIGPDPPERTEPGELTPEAVVELAHERHCAAIIPHPYRDSTVKDVDAPFDAVEVNGKHPATHKAARGLAADRDLPLVGGSDAHYPFEVGRAHTHVDADDESPEALVDAIRAGHIEPEVTYSNVDVALGRAYDVVHRIRGHR